MTYDPDQLVPVDGAAWWRLLHVLGPGVIPPRSLMRDVAAELRIEAARAGGGGAITLDLGALARWVGISEPGIMVELERLAALGLVRQRPDRPEAWELTMAPGHADLLRAAG